MKTADDREGDLFREALRRTTGLERETFLSQACRGNPALRDRLETLLQAHEKAGALLEDPADAPTVPTSVCSAPLTEQPGDKIGRYKLCEIIGEGGCGVVYVAEQKEPVRRQVALKVIRLGMGTKNVVARFEAERQALAMMDHPNIAKVLDGGVSEGGRPYFVMELVRGARITEYCDQNNLPTAEHLKLFVVRDIECHLSHRPVSAAAPTLRYRAAKCVQRHRRALGTIGTIAVLAMLGTTMSVWQAHRARQAEQERTSLRSIEWALKTALPEIERLLERDDCTAAFKLVDQARPFVSDDRRFQALALRAGSVLSIESDPPGGKVFLREWKDKSLPTLYHWYFAAVPSNGEDLRAANFLGAVIMQSNFARRGPAPAGQDRGLTPRGVYDLAGNAKEWCLNETTGGMRLNLGGGWNDVHDVFAHAERYPPFRRAADFGFRCMKLLIDHEEFQQGARQVQLRSEAVSLDQEPCSDEVLEIYKKLYAYNKVTNIHAKIEARLDVSAYTRLEWVSFDAAYGGERMSALLCLPRVGKPPFQIVIHIPGAAARSIPATNYYADYVGDHYAKASRAWILPSLKCTYHRKPPDGLCKMTDLDHVICSFKDIMATIDYLETRPEIDVGKLACEALGAGAVWGSVLPALEHRFKVVLVWGTGLNPRLEPEFSQFNFAPQVKIPFLLQSGRYDLEAVEASIKPLMDLLGTPVEDKQAKSYEAGYSADTLNESWKDKLAFLDKYLGTNTASK